MKQHLLGKIIGILISLISTGIMAGWILGIHPLTVIFPNYVLMKFITALCFLFSGIILTFISLGKRSRSSFSTLIVYIVCPLLISLFMSTLLLSRILDIRTGLEELFIREIGQETLENIPGLPSLATMLAFILVSITGLIQLLYTSAWKQWFTRVTGFILCITGLIAIVGYILNIPYLYFVIPEISTAIALNSSILLVILGFGFITTANGTSS